MKLLISYGLDVFESDDFETLEQAKSRADWNALISSTDIVIYNIEKIPLIPLAKRQWIAHPADEVERMKPILNFGSSGFYDCWVDE